ncbi:Fe-Mn family superoxide dismutase [Roseateles saccharophilus]|uniref:superoxide dismutase n=1 Tax=Roseateles saccharophilus TaxID=304 RepID=A0A4R3V9H9_ROSSA|nr:Fe-Mn family superoxide dismutase [Roseateles saccharophilus]MDG0832636.1 superoxide dismutase [Roseateles saccharophilus]TCV00373.1 Fe-Mn family superoxide dismutase [Roseateles saccharophilus]
MNAIPRELPFDAANLPGLSERLLLSHHQNNYGGAVKRLNAIRTRLGAIPRGTLPGFELNGLKREELIAANSMLLHELYFDSLAAQPDEMAPAMALALDGSFGSVEAWRDEFTAIGKALGGGSGWVLLSLLPREGLLVNQWAADHTHALAGAIPILALDMYEHAYHLDYGAAASGYVDAFMARIDWTKVYERYQQTVHACSEGLAADAGGVDLAQAIVLDVRRAGMFVQARTMLPGARWCDPAHVEDWAGELPRDREVLVYCIYGHEVGRATAMKLCALGVQARFLPGGIDGWTRAGRPLQTRGGEA